MPNLSESWRRTTTFLRRAFDAAGSPPLPDFEDYLDHNELQLAADVLLDFGDEQPDCSGAAKLIAPRAAKVTVES